ncbi:putative RNA-directed DNA polymerase [Tanacetum coccineum]
MVFYSSSPPKNNQQISAENLGHEVVYESPNDDTSNPVLDEVGNMNNMTEEGGLDPLDQIGRPKRHRSQPKCLDDFIVKLPPSVDNTQTTPTQASSTVHPLSNCVSYEHFSNSHKVFLAAIDSIDEPKSFHQAIKDDRWKETMRKEIRALKENDTWTLKNLPDGKRAIDFKWVYKVNRPNGEVERYKARLVAKGFTQREGVDYHDTFAPVAKLVMVRTLLTMATKNNWFIHQLDVNNAFLHGDLTKETWYYKFTNSLIALDFKQSKADHSFFIYQPKETFVSALIYVDDVILMGNDVVKIQHTKTELNNRFSIKDIRNLKYFLGIEVARTPEGLVLSQRKYTLDILVDCGFEGCRSSIFPIKQNHKLDKSDAEPKVDASRYRRITTSLGCRSSGSSVLEIYTWTRTGYILLLSGSPISWKTKKQSVVSCSSIEAEYRLMASTVSEVLWVRWLLQELNVASTSPTSLFCDNQAARHIANNLVFHERTKHVEMDCFFVRE